MATKWLLKEQETGWYFGGASFRAIGDPPSAMRPLNTKESAKRFPTKKAAQAKAAEAAKLTGRAFVVERA